jgi:hypothetical protein
MAFHELPKEGNSAMLYCLVVALPQIMIGMQMVLKIASTNAH